MVYIGSVSSVVKFGGQTTKNVHDVPKVCLEMTLCVYACFVEFYVFVLYNIHVMDPKIIYDYVRVEKFWENIPKDHPRVLEEGPKVGAKTVQDNPTNGWFLKGILGILTMFISLKHLKEFILQNQKPKFP